MSARVKPALLLHARNDGCGQRHSGSAAARFATRVISFYRELIVGSGFGDSELGCGTISDPSRSTKTWFNFARN